MAAPWSRSTSPPAARLLVYVAVCGACEHWARDSRMLRAFKAHRDFGNNKCLSSSSLEPHLETAVPCTASELHLPGSNCPRQGRSRTPHSRLRSDGAFEGLGLSTRTLAQGKHGVRRWVRQGFFKDTESRPGHTECGPDCTVNTGQAANRSSP